MSSSSNDFQLEMSMSLNSSTEEVTITLDSIYTGSSHLSKSTFTGP